jgi:uncharacterized protein (TIGR03067 family)
MRCLAVADSQEFGSRTFNDVGSNCTKANDQLHPTFGTPVAGFNHVNSKPTMRGAIMRLQATFALTMLALTISTGHAAGQKPALKSEGREAAREDLKKLEGVWDRTYMEYRGEVWPQEKIEGWTAMYEGDRLTLRIHGKVYRESIVTLDPSRSPRAMNSWDLDGPAADQTVLGIYEFDGDTVKVCFALPCNKRPTEFTTKKGTGFLYCIYKRGKTSNH